MDTAQENKALETMLNERAKWNTWKHTAYIQRDRYKNEPQFRADEIVGLDGTFSKSRFEFQTRKRFSHIGAYDTEKKRWVVLRTTKMSTSYRGNVLWELEVQKNKSRTYARYRGLNDRWEQDMQGVRNYKIDVVEGQDLGMPIAHQGHEDRTSPAHVGMLVIDSGRQEKTIRRIIGVTPDGSELLTEPVWQLGVDNPENDYRGGAKQAKYLRVLTMEAMMRWTLRLKSIMRECDA